MDDRFYFTLIVFSQKKPVTQVIVVNFSSTILKVFIFKKEIKDNAVKIT